MKFSQQQGTKVNFSLMTLTWHANDKETSVDFERTHATSVVVSIILKLSQELSLGTYFLLTEQVYKQHVMGVEHKIVKELMDSDDISGDVT